jgi:hypothetical protein
VESPRRRDVRTGFDGPPVIFYNLGFPSDHPFRNSPMGGISNRMKEVKLRRHRRQKMAKFQAKLKKATTSEKLVMAEKIRKLTTGASVVIARMGLEDRKRG